MSNRDARSASPCGAARNRACWDRRTTCSNTSVRALPWTNPTTRACPLSCDVRAPGPLTVKPEQAKVSAYFNVDNGSGKIRGVYLQENEAETPLFEAWMQPFKDLGMTTLTCATQAEPTISRSMRRHSRLPVHPGPDRLRHADSPFQHGRLRPSASRRYEAGRGHCCQIRLQRADADTMLPRKPIEKALPKNPKSPTKSDDRAENGAARVTGFRWLPRLVTYVPMSDNNLPINELRVR